MTPTQKLHLLRLLVEVEIWRDDPAMLEAIFRSYLNIIVENPSLQKRFGTPAYWKAVREMLFPHIYHFLLPADTHKCSTEATKSDVHDKRPQVWCDRSPKYLRDVLIYTPLLGLSLTSRTKTALFRATNSKNPMLLPFFKTVKFFH